MSEQLLRVKVGVGSIILRNNRSEVLLSKRLGAHGAGQYGSAGGHVEYGESVSDALKREIAEECGDEISIGEPFLLSICDMLSYPPHHYVDIGFAVDWLAGTPIRTEPDRSGPWSWYSLERLPDNLFHVLPTYFEALLTGQVIYRTYSALAEID